ncbi:hypothetical protein SUGI_0058850 [Cryptomeria japonica]|uniref:NAC transcription factor 29 n=1 Tax=Cryptomeria japonica TaxID=3369 RepID=UPI002408E451|nr:NAC transcription factor 29 [Cryptomeria japonica]GLJ07119.1 hypothetical protein SUGI_0058850 [Cryptomeria japonica]
MAEIVCPQPQLPPGFRFHPTDEELLVHYLRNKISSSALPVSIITDVDVYKFNPWELPGKASFGDREWYFFSPRDRKYPNGSRPNRAAACGYWKATGTDKPILNSVGTQKVGVKKALVFYKGRPPKGLKTSWIMHEYRLTDSTVAPKAPRKKWSLRLDDWVLCRIYQKAGHSPSPSSEGRSQEQDLIPLQFQLHHEFQGPPTLDFPVQSEDPNFLDGFLDSTNAWDASGSVTAKLNSIKRTLSLLFDDDDAEVEPSPKRNMMNNLSNSNSQPTLYVPPPFNPYKITLSDFNEMLPSPFTESRPWDSQKGHTWLS